jgi:hypothetical protein
VLPGHVRGERHPQLFDALGPSVAVEDVEGVAVLGLNPPVLARSSRAMKRALDICGALALLLVAAPEALPGLTIPGSSPMMSQMSR